MHALRDRLTHSLPAFVALLGLLIGATLMFASGNALAASSKVVGESTYGTLIADAAHSQEGLPYVWDGGNKSGPTGGGYDCSGLVMYAYGQAGITFPSHNASNERTYALTTLKGKTVSESAAQVGDLVFFYTSADGWHHVGIYAGHGKMVNAFNGGTKVRTEPVTDAVGSMQFVHIGKVSQAMTSGSTRCTAATYGYVCLTVTIASAARNEIDLHAGFHVFHGTKIYAASLWLDLCRNGSLATCSGGPAGSSLTIRKTLSATVAYDKKVVTGAKYVDGRVAFSYSSTGQGVIFESPILAPGLQ